MENYLNTGFFITELLISMI